MFKLHKYSCKKCIPALIIILFFIGLLPPNLYGQVKIKERVELQNTKGVESYIWPVNGCEYDTFDSSRIFVKFDPNPVSPGNITIASLWLDENFTWQYWSDGEPLLLRTFELDPDYGECVRIGDGLYRISIPDTVTSDSVAVAFNYINFRHFCAGKGSELVLDDKDCLFCFPYWRALSKGYTQDTLIIKPDSFVVYIEPEECYPGDTVQVVIKKRLSDGTLVDFPATQTYEIAKLEGCMLGNILADNDSGSYFYDVSQPIYFAAADTLVGDSTGTVLLQVGLVDPAKKKELPLTHPTHIESNDCFTGSFLSDAYNYFSTNILAPLIKFDYPKPDTILWITADPNPQMPVINCKATLDNYCKRGTIFFNWEYWIRYTLYRHEFSSNDTICRRTGRVKITGTTEYEIGDPNGGGCPAESNWDVSFDYNPLLANIEVEFKGKHYKYEGGCDSIIDQWYEGNEIFTGGDVYVKVIAKDEFGKIIAIGETSGGKILGRNPSTETMANYITNLDFEAIIRKETARNHFNNNDTTLYYSTYGYTLPGWKYNKRGYPYYGVPNGFGYAQIDNSPAPTELDLWNWQKNLMSGQTKHNSNKVIVRNNIRTIGALLDEKVVLMNAYQMYNSGKPYWIWIEGVNGKLGYWDRNPDRGKNPEYAKVTYNIYLSLLNQ